MASPYIDNSDRLANVIAAIQVMGTYKFYKLDFEKWSDRICGNNSESEYWKNIFKQHPEFFRIDATKTKASLVWRRSYPKFFDVDKLAMITREEFDQRKDKSRLSRTPLSNNDIQTLIESAIKLNTSALEQKKDKQWWKPALAGLVGVILGSLIQLIG